MGRLDPRNEHTAIVGYDPDEGIIFVQLAEPLHEVTQEVHFLFPLRDSSDRLIKQVGSRAGALVQAVLTKVAGVRAINVSPYEIKVIMGPLVKMNLKLYKDIVEYVPICLHIDDVFDLWDLDDAKRELRTLEHRLEGKKPKRWTPKWRRRLCLDILCVRTIEDKLVRGLVWELKSYAGHRTDIGKCEEAGTRKGHFFATEDEKTRLLVREEAAFEQACARYKDLEGQAQKLRDYIASY